MTLVARDGAWTDEEAEGGQKRRKRELKEGLKKGTEGMRDENTNKTKGKETDGRKWREDIVVIPAFLLINSCWLAEGK